MDWQTRSSRSAYSRPGFDLHVKRERRAAGGQPETFAEGTLYPNTRACGSSHCRRWGCGWSRQVTADRPGPVRRRRLAACEHLYPCAAFRPRCLSRPGNRSIADQGIRPARVTLCDFLQRSTSCCQATPTALGRCARTAQPDRGERDRELVKLIKKVVHGRLLASGDRRQPSG
jgi:hypothetical protein